MGRLIVGEERINEQLGSLFEKSAIVVGLVIGQLTEQKDYALAIVKTPKQEDFDENHDASKEIQEKEVNKAARKKKKTSSIDAIDESFVAAHTKQVLRMIPGGLDIIGIFALAPPDIMKTAQIKLRQVLFAVQKMIKKEEVLLERNEVSRDRLVLQICSVTRKITCRTYDVFDPKSTANPAEWKFQSFANKWMTLQTSATLDVVIPVCRAALGHSLRKQLQTGLLAFCDNVWNALCTVNGKLLPSEDFLDPSQQGKKKKHDVPSSAPLKFDVQLLTKQKSSISMTQPLTIQCAAKMLVRGRMLCRAYVHNKATVSEAIQCLKNDLVRTLTSRCELLCEDLLQTEEEQDPKVLYECPVRVFVPLAGTAITLCDYMFQDEALSDSVNRFTELLDMQVAEHDIENDCESIPDQNDTVKPEHMPKYQNIKGTSPDVQKAFSLTFNMLGLLASGLVATLAMGLSYMYLGEN